MLSVKCHASLLAALCLLETDIVTVFGVSVVAAPKNVELGHCNVMKHL